MKPGDSLLMSVEDRHEISATYTSSANLTFKGTSEDCLSEMRLEDLGFEGSAGSRLNLLKPMVDRSEGVDL